VDYVRKFDGRLQIEMLRRLRPDRFKTRGVQVNPGVKDDVFALTEEQRHELQRINREFLLSSPVESGGAPPPRLPAISYPRGMAGDLLPALVRERSVEQLGGARGGWARGHSR